MFPISDTVKSKSFPLITISIILLNVGIFMYEFLSGTRFIEQYALIPALVDFSNPITLIPFVSSQFLHGGLFHIASNMWFLWIFGDNVEDRLGKIPFIFFYLIAGIAGGLLQYYFTSESVIPMLGASGAVSGVLGAYYIFFPQARIKSLLLFFFVVTIAYVPAVTYIFLWFIIQLFSGIASLPFLQFQSGGVAFWAHIGGFVAGYLIARSYRKDEDKGYIEGEIVE